MVHSGCQNGFLLEIRATCQRLLCMSQVIYIWHEGIPHAKPRRALLSKDSSFLKERKHVFEYHPPKWSSIHRNKHWVTNWWIAHTSLAQCQSLTAIISIKTTTKKKVAVKALQKDGKRDLEYTDLRNKVSENAIFTLTLGEYLDTQ